MSKWRAERMGTASHYENGKTIERLQRDFDGIEQPRVERPRTRAELRRLQRERDIEDAFLPEESMQDVTAEHDKDAGKTFSHRRGKEMSVQEQKKAAARLVDCPDVVNQAGLYDTITIRDSDGEEYERELDFPETKTPPIFNAFRGDYVGAIHSIGGYTYQLVKVKKANGRVYALGVMERDGEQAEKRVVLTGRQRKNQKREQTTREDCHRSELVQHRMDRQVPRKNRDWIPDPSVSEWRRDMPVTRVASIAPMRNDCFIRYYGLGTRNIVLFRPDWHVIAKPRRGRRREWKVTSEVFNNLESMVKFGKISDMNGLLQYMMELKIKEI